MVGRIPIMAVSPVIEGGRYPAKATVGEAVPVSALVFREGHDALNADMVLTGPDGKRRPWVRMSLDPNEPDLWHAEVTPDQEGPWTFSIEGWSDPVATWRHDAGIKIPAGIDVELTFTEGALLLERVADALPKRSASRKTLADAVTAVRDTSRPEEVRFHAAVSPEVDAVLAENPLRDLVTEEGPFPLFADRERALFGSWYEFFPRSEGAYVETDPATGAERIVSGNFGTAAKRLDAVAEMGFEIVYLPPIHPIGRVNRKGRNNTLDPGPEDVGSPWAIGSKKGGHDAIHPDLGKMRDFDAFVRRAKKLGLEVAIGLSLQAAPDHPWVKKHQEWFTTRADGSIAYAENPPKKYQDIYPINFDNDPDGIYAECLRVIRVWIEAGVTIFRVDNPHTKPLNFWHWLIWEVKKTDPGVLFLAEAFTRPAMMHQLAKIGFTQSYTYFTWRTERGELEEYGRELATNSHYMRPNFFVNTPDILHESLQFGGPPMFKIRAVLASMMSPTWGVYSGFELFEHVAVRPGSEEYHDTEKYQLRPRDWAGAEASGRSLAPYLRRLNEIRRAHPALQQLRTLHFHPVDNPNLICFSKTDPGSADAVLVVVNLSSRQTQIGTTSLDLPTLGLDWHERVAVTDELNGARYDWGQFNYVELDPYREPAHIFSVDFGRPVAFPPPVD